MSPLREEEVSRSGADGFLLLTSFADEDLLETLRRAYDEALSGEVDAPDDRMLGGLTRQVMLPSSAHPVFDYSQKPVAPAGTAMTSESLQFWLPLDDADEENSCMHFLPGHHTAPLLPHRVTSGGATVHSYGTPQYTPPNRSADRPRRAYIFNIFNIATVRGRAGISGRGS
jgi:hypothetical protein